MCPMMDDEELRQERVGEVNPEVEWTCERFRQVLLEEARREDHLFREQCPSLEQLRAFAEDTCNEQEADAINVHLSHCPKESCQGPVRRRDAALPFEEAEAGDFTMTHATHPCWITPWSQVIAAVPQEEHGAFIQALAQRPEGDPARLAFLLHFILEGSPLAWSWMSQAPETLQLGAEEYLLACLYECLNPTLEDEQILQVYGHLEALWRALCPWSKAQEDHVKHVLLHVSPLNAASLLTLWLGLMDDWQELREGEHRDPDTTFLTPPPMHLLAWLKENVPDMAWESSDLPRRLYLRLLRMCEEASLPSKAGDTHEPEPEP